MINFFRKNKINFENYVCVISKNSNDFKKILKDSKFLTLCFKKIREQKAKKLILKNNNITIQVLNYPNILEELTPKERISFWAIAYKRYELEKIIFEN